MEGTAFLAEFDPFGATAGYRVLDVGCALGGKTLAVRDSGSAVAVGIDTDIGKIGQALTEAARTGPDGVAFAVQNGLDLGFEDGQFDLVLLLDIVEHLQDPRATLRECARVLNKGGRMLVGFPPYKSPWGGHLFSHIRVPWAHLLFPDSEVLDVWRELHGEMLARGEINCSRKRACGIIEAENVADLWDLNQMTIGRFLDLVQETQLTLKSIRFKTPLGLGGLATRVPALREYIVTRFVAVLEA